MAASKQVPVQPRAARAKGRAASRSGRSPGGSEAIYRGLRRAIIEQSLMPGTKLPEDTIGEAFGVSRTLARGALTRLAAEGLVDLRRNRGAAVASPSLVEARDVFALRRELENLVVARLCGHLTAEQAQRLRAHVAREQGARNRDGPESIRLAGEFHTLLAEMTGSALLARYVAELVSRSSVILALYARPHSSDCAVNEHLQLIEALEAGDPARARQLMEHHLGAVQERALLARPEPGADALAAILKDYVASPHGEGGR
jgi:DNA-binding GntR family transcriptional regulator